MKTYVLIGGVGLPIVQVKQTSGDYIDVPYREDAVLVNLGALMQMWTSDTYRATVRPNSVVHEHLPSEQTPTTFIQQIWPQCYGSLITFSLQPHRVLLPEEESEKRSVRQSLAFFCHPDNQVLVECVDNSNKYPPVLAGDDCLNRLNRTYSY